jgi:CHAD domain-containing protein
MVRSSEWITGAKPDQSITDVGRRVLRERLKTVWSYAPLAAKKYEEDIEYVHQLRVATRRAGVGLQIFADLLPKRETRWMRKMLRELRQAAGDARDLDVLGGRLRKIAKEKKGSHLGAVVKRVAARRRKAQKPVLAAHKSAKLKGYKARSNALANAVGWQRDQREPTFAEAARTALAPLVDEFFAAANTDLSDIEALHQMRIAGKQVRYAMELLAGAFDDSFRGKLYATFEEVHEKLGTINDHATAITMFNEWYERADDNGGRGELAELTASEEKQLDARCQEFRDWWTSERATELRRHFEIVLRLSPSSTSDAATLTEPVFEEAQEFETVAPDRKGALARVCSAPGCSIEEISSLQVLTNSTRKGGDRHA